MSKDKLRQMYVIAWHSIFLIHNLIHVCHNLIHNLVSCWQALFEFNGPDASSSNQLGPNSVMISAFFVTYYRKYKFLQNYWIFFLHFLLFFICLRHWRSICDIRAAFCRRQVSTRQLWSNVHSKRMSKNLTIFSFLSPSIPDNTMNSVSLAPRLEAVFV